jgi:ubiquinone/menaquinone biosynthesis C-methylase UbiE
MEQSKNEQNADEFYAETYDDSVPDWPGEIDFYRALAAKARRDDGSVLEIACGTGRVAIRLAQDGAKVVGLDLSRKMIEVAKQKSKELGNVRWFQGDMRAFRLEEKFNLALVPGHSFQNLNTPQDQVACLRCIKRHLNPTGLIVIHLDHMNAENVRWLGELCGAKRGVFEGAEEFKHQQTGRQTRASRAWSYEPSTQTAIVQTIWEEMDTDGQVVNRVEREPIRLHCVFRFEMEHLLTRAGFKIEAVYGDFFGHELQDDSPSMIWVARTR